MVTAKKRLTERRTRVQLEEVDVVAVDGNGHVSPSRSHRSRREMRDEVRARAR